MLYICNVSFEQPIKETVMGKMMKYKMRAECMNDIFAFTSSFAQSINNFAIHGNTHIPDVVFEFQSWKSMKSIMKVLSDIPDSHVMMETLQPKSKYTGQR